MSGQSPSPEEARAERVFGYDCGRQVSAGALRKQPPACPTRLERAEMAKRRTRPAEERFWAKVDRNGPNGCWLWLGSGCRGYGQFSPTPGKNARVHRYAYELLVGPIPDGLQLDHLCRVRNCVNPAHLEPVTPRENWLRGEAFTAQNLRKTHCDKGHEYTPENTIVWRGFRRCRICKKASNAKSNARRDARKRALREGAAA